MAKATNAVRRRMEKRGQDQRLTPDEVDELLDLTGAATEDADASPADLSPASPKPAELVIRPAAVEVPLAQYRPEVRQFAHVEVVLNPAQGRILRRLFDALDNAHARTANGKHVNSAADCVRWLLDQLESVRPSA